MKIDFPTDTGSLRQLWKEAFGDEDAFLDKFFATGYSPRRCLQGTEDGRVACMLYWFDVSWAGKPYAYLYAIATAQSHRNRGLCRCLMAQAQELLQQQGYAGAILVPAGAHLFAFYEKMGYRPFSPMTQEEIAADSSPVRLKEIHAQAYGQLRKQLLNRQFVLQEGATLSFLGTYARFYAGQDFAFCLEIRNGNAFIPECLGNRQALGGALCALHLPRATLRSPGGETPFAMILPFRPDAPTPDWFCLALD